RGGDRLRSAKTRLSVPLNAHHKAAIQNSTARLWLPIQTYGTLTVDKGKLRVPSFTETSCKRSNLPCKRPNVLPCFSPLQSLQWERHTALKRQTWGSVVSQRAWLERRSRAGALPCARRGRPSGITFAAPPATAGVMGTHLLPAALIATGRMRTERLARITSSNWSTTIPLYIRSRASLLWR